MIRMVEIPPDRWASFLDMINRSADGRAVRVEVARRELGDQEMGNRLPLEEIEYESKGSERGKLVVSVGSDRGELTHLVDEPTRIAVGLNEGNEPQLVAIDERGGGTTIVHFEEFPALSSDYGATP